MPKKQFGLLCKDSSYSFSKAYFTSKFKLLELSDCKYDNFELNAITEFQKIITTNPTIKGLNVTIPYKEAIIPYLDSLSKKAKEINAVNTIRFLKNGKLKGYNTDYYGFKKAIKPLLKKHHKKALILGTGGASKAVIYSLQQLGISYNLVSRKHSNSVISYADLNENHFNEQQIIINCTPVGTCPNSDEFPDLPYHLFTQNHLAFDLIYNPTETQFLTKAKLQGATIQNGYSMLLFQAEKAWEIWNK